MAENLARIYGTEEDKVNCPFYFKVSKGTTATAADSSSDSEADAASICALLARAAVFVTAPLSIAADPVPTLCVCVLLSSPLLFQIGACRHGDRCSRTHNRPLFSQTLLIPHMYTLPPVDPQTGMPTVTTKNT